MTIELNKENFDSFIKSSGSKLVVIDFWATWCPPCRVFGPIFSKVSEDFNGKDIYFAKVNVDDIEQETLDKHRVSGIPCVVVFTSDGSEVTRFVGAMDENKFSSKIKALIDPESK